MNRDVNALLQDPAVVREIERRAGMPAPGSPIQFAEFIKKEIDTWGEVVRATGHEAGDLMRARLRPRACSDREPRGLMSERA